MTDQSGSVPPFPGFPGFPPAEMLDRMWGMMRLMPFGSAFPGVEPGVAQGFGPSLSMMSDMMTPLTSVEELDKRITDMRAVEQWLKLNLSMLQSAIQALEVQRATLATLRAFGAFAQSQMTPPPDTAPSHGAGHEPGVRAKAAAGQPHEAQFADPARTTDEPSGGGESAPAFDPTAWWNLLQSQFNQLAQFAMTQPAGQDANAAAPDEAANPAAKSSGAAKRAPGKAAPRAAKKAPTRAE